MKLKSIKIECEMIMSDDPTDKKLNLMLIEDKEVLEAIERAQEHFNKKEYDLTHCEIVFLLLSIACSEDVYKVYGSLYEKSDE
jgi:hypothetical protein